MTMKQFHEMTADELAEHRLAWREGKAEIWFATVWRRSPSDSRRRILADLESPTELLLGASIRDLCDEGWQLSSIPERRIAAKRHAATEEKQDG